MTVVEKIEVDTVETSVSDLAAGDVFINGHGDLCRFATRERRDGSNGPAYLVMTGTGAMQWYGLDARVKAIVLF